MAAAQKFREPRISDMTASRSWSGTIDIGDGITLPKRVTTHVEGAAYNEPVDLYDRKAGVTLYGYIESMDRDGYDYALVVVNSMTPDGRYDVIPPRVFVKGGTE